MLVCRYDSSSGLEKLSPRHHPDLYILDRYLRVIVRGQTLLARLTLDGIRLVPPLRRQERSLGIKKETTLGSRLPSFHNLSLFSGAFSSQTHRPNVHDAGPRAIPFALPGRAHQGLQLRLWRWEFVKDASARCRGLCDPAQVWRPFWALLDGNVFLLPILLSCSPSHLLLL